MQQRTYVLQEGSPSTGVWERVRAYQHATTALEARDQGNADLPAWYNSPNAGYRVVELHTARIVEYDHERPVLVEAY